MAEQQLPRRIELDADDVLQLRVFGARKFSDEGIGGLRRRADVQPVQDRVEVERVGAFRRIRQLDAHALEFLERARRPIAGHETEARADARARGPARPRILHRYAAEPIERFLRPPHHAQRVSGVEARGGHRFVVWKEPRDALEARERGVDVRRRAPFRQREASAHDIRHGRRVGLRIILQQPLNRRLARADIVRDLELVERHLQQRIVGHRALRERVEDGLKIFQRFRVAAVLHERHAALVLAPREFFGIALRAENDAAGRQQDGETKTELSRHGTIALFGRLAPTLIVLVLFWPLGHRSSTWYEPAAIDASFVGG